MLDRIYREFCLSSAVKMPALSKTCPECNSSLHVRKSVCDCGHCFVLKRSKVLSNTARKSLRIAMRHKRTLETTRVYVLQKWKHHFNAQTRKLFYTHYRHSYSTAHNGSILQHPLTLPTTNLTSVCMSSLQVNWVGIHSKFHVHMQYSPSVSLAATLQLAGG